MKQKISISIDEETIKHIEKFVEKGTFRNKSHAVEFAVNKVLEGEDEK